MALTEMVIMPGEDYQAICDSVRAKTGGTELLKSGEVAPAIDGIKIGIELPELNNLATTADIIKDKAAYDDKGGKITGTIPFYSGIVMDFDNLTENTDNTITVKGTRTSKVALSANGYASIKVPKENFGDADPSQVLSGVTFTSAAGLKIPGELMMKNNSGQYCWRKYQNEKTYEVIDENLDRVVPSDLGTTSYPDFTITNDGYFQLNSGTAVLNAYYLPTGATNGKTKIIYYKKWNYVYGEGSYYTYTKKTITDSYTEEQGELLGYVVSDNNEDYPNNGVAEDNFWYILIEEEQQPEGNIE